MRRTNFSIIFVLFICLWIFVHGGILQTSDMPPQESSPSPLSTPVQSVSPIPTVTPTASPMKSVEPQISSSVNPSPVFSSGIPLPSATPQVTMIPKPSVVQPQPSTIPESSMVAPPTVSVVPQPSYTPQPSPSRSSIQAESSPVVATPSIVPQPSTFPQASSSPQVAISPAKSALVPEPSVVVPQHSSAQPQPSVVAQPSTIPTYSSAHPHPPITPLPTIVPQPSIVPEVSVVHPQPSVAAQPSISPRLSTVPQMSGMQPQPSNSMPSIVSQHSVAPVLSSVPPTASPMKSVEPRISSGANPSPVFSSSVPLPSVAPQVTMRPPAKSIVRPQPSIVPQPSVAPQSSKNTSVSPQTSPKPLPSISPAASTLPQPSSSVVPQSSQNSSVLPKSTIRPQPSTIPPLPQPSPSPLPRLPRQVLKRFSHYNNLSCNDTTYLQTENSVEECPSMACYDQHGFNKRCVQSNFVIPSINSSVIDSLPEPGIYWASIQYNAEYCTQSSAYSATFYPVGKCHVDYGGFFAIYNSDGNRLTETRYSDRSCTIPVETIVNSERVGTCDTFTSTSFIIKIFYNKIEQPKVSPRPSIVPKMSSVRPRRSINPMPQSSFSPQRSTIPVAQSIRPQNSTVRPRESLVPQSSKNSSIPHPQSSIRPLPSGSPPLPQPSTSPLPQLPRQVLKRRSHYNNPSCNDTTYYITEITAEICPSTCYEEYGFNKQCVQSNFVIPSINSSVIDSLPEPGIFWAYIEYSAQFCTQSSAYSATFYPVGKCHVDYGGFFAIYNSDGNRLTETRYSDRSCTIPVETFVNSERVGTCDTFISASRITKIFYNKIEQPKVSPRPSIVPKMSSVQPRPSINPMPQSSFTPQRSSIRPLPSGSPPLPQPSINPLPQLPRQVLKRYSHYSNPSCNVTTYYATENTTEICPSTTCYEEYGFKKQCVQSNFVIPSINSSVIDSLPEPGIYWASIQYSAQNCSQSSAYSATFYPIGKCHADYAGFFTIFDLKGDTISYTRYYDQRCTNSYSTSVYATNTGTCTNGFGSESQVIKVFYNRIAKSDPICFAEQRSNGFSESLVLEDFENSSNLKVSVQGGSVLKDQLLNANGTAKVGCGVGSGSQALFMSGTSRTVDVPLFGLKGPVTLMIKATVSQFRNEAEYPQCSRVSPFAFISALVLQQNGDNWIQVSSTSMINDFTFEIKSPTTKNYMIRWKQDNFHPSMDQWSIDDISITKVELPCSGQGTCNILGCRCKPGYTGTICSVPPKLILLGQSYDNTSCQNIYSFTTNTVPEDYQCPTCVSNANGFSQYCNSFNLSNQAFSRISLPSAGNYLVQALYDDKVCGTKSETRNLAMNPLGKCIDQNYQYFVYEYDGKYVNKRYYSNSICSDTEKVEQFEKLGLAGSCQVSPYVMESSMLQIYHTTTAKPSSLCYSNNRRVPSTATLLNEDFEDGILRTNDFLSVQGGSIVVSGRLNNTMMQVGCGSFSGNSSLYMFGNSTRRIQTQFKEVNGAVTIEIRFNMHAMRQRAIYPQCSEGGNFINRVLLSIVEISNPTVPIKTFDVPPWQNEFSFLFHSRGTKSYSLIFEQPVFDPEVHQWSIDDLIVTSVEKTCSGNGYCAGSCKCNEGFFGADCSLTVVEDFEGFCVPVLGNCVGSQQPLSWTNNNYIYGTGVSSIPISNMMFAGLVQNFALYVDIDWMGSLTLSIRSGTQEKLLASNIVCDSTFPITRYGICKLNVVFSTMSNRNFSSAFQLQPNALVAYKYLSPVENFDSLVSNNGTVELIIRSKNGMSQHFKSSIILENYGVFLPNTTIVDMIAEQCTNATSLTTTTAFTRLSQSNYDTVKIGNYIRLMNCGETVVQVQDKLSNRQVRVSIIPVQNLFSTLSYRVSPVLASAELLSNPINSSSLTPITTSLSTDKISGTVTMDARIAVFQAANGENSARFAISSTFSLTVKAGTNTYIDLLKYRYNAIAILGLKLFEPRLDVGLFISATVETTLTFSVNTVIDLESGLVSPIGRVSQYLFNFPVCSGEVSAQVFMKPSLLILGVVGPTAEITYGPKFNISAGGDLQCCGDTSSQLTISLNGSGRVSVFKTGVTNINVSVPILSQCSALLPQSLCGIACNPEDEKKPELPIPPPPPRDFIPNFAPPRPIRMGGDPHLTSIDGIDYTFNGVGDYTLLAETNASDLKLEIQVRLTPLNQGSVINAVAFRYKNSTFEFYNDDSSIYVNGQMVYGLATLEKASQFDRTEIALNFDKSSNTYEFFSVPRTVVASNNQSIANVNAFSITIAPVFDALNLIYTIPSVLFNNTKGLIGNFNFDPSDDLIDAVTGKAVTTMTERSVYEFGLTWKVSSERKLFTRLFDEVKFDLDFVPLFGDELTVDPHPACANLPTIAQQKQCNFDIFATKKDYFAQNFDKMNTITDQKENEQISRPSFFPNITVDVNSTSLCAEVDVQTLQSTFSNENGNYFMSYIEMRVNNQTKARINFANSTSTVLVCGWKSNQRNTWNYVLENSRKTQFVSNQNEYLLIAPISPAASPNPPITDTGSSTDTTTLAIAIAVPIAAAVLLVLIVAILVIIAIVVIAVIVVNYNKQSKQKWNVNNQSVVEQAQIELENI